MGDGFPALRADGKGAGMMVSACGVCLRPARLMPLTAIEVPMRVAVFFATREGQTRKIAEHIDAKLRAHGIGVDLIDVRARQTALDWTQYENAWVAASVHAGLHEREMIRFVRDNRNHL